MKAILKLIWANRELYRQMLGEVRDIAVILILIVLIVWFTLNAMSEHQENYRLNHLENRMNSFDPNIPFMELK